MRQYKGYWPTYNPSGVRCLTTVFKANIQRTGQHPTQKPIDLIEKLIKAYSNPGDIVLDPFIGSGTTAVAAIKTGHHYIGYEKEQKYFDVALNRISTTAVSTK